jgi:hypothetical protein
MVVALGAAGVLTGPAATAAGDTPTQIVDFVASPSAVSYPSPEITVSGVLETTGSQPLAKTWVNVSYPQGAGTAGASALTDATGHFRLPIAQVVPAPVEATYLGDSVYGASSATASVTAAQVFPAKIVLDPIAPAPRYTNVTVTGTLLMQLPGGSWVPSPDALVRYDQTALLSTFTDPNGKFAIGAEVLPGDPLSISAPAGFGGTFWWSGAASSGPLFLPLSADPTWVCGAVGADTTPAPAAGIGFGIHTCYEDAAGATHNYSGAVQLYFQAAGGSSWTQMAATTTGTDGFGHVSVSGYLNGGGLAAGNWKWTVPARSGFAASDSQAFPVVISVPTKITGARVARSGGTERLTGRLSFKTAGVSGATVLIEHLSRHGWRQVAKVQTKSGGQFAYQFSSQMTGRYRVVFRGSALSGAEARFGSFAPSVSRAVRFR